MNAFNKLEFDEKIKKLNEILKNSKNTVFFGGAGVSTESGIPDFRSVDGLYSQKYAYPPETILSGDFFYSHTEEFYRFYRDKMLCLDAKPNKAHEKLAELEEKGNSQGGFYCNYSTFAWAYRYEIRRTARDGLSHYLLLCSLTEIQEGNSWFQEGNGLDTTMEYLREAIAVSLRRTDIYTRYSKNQYLLLMLQMKQEDCSSISQRIEQKFRRYPGVRKFRLHYYYTPAVHELDSSWKSPKSFHSPQKG